MHFSIDQEDATTVFRLKEPKLDSATASHLKAEFLILAQPDVETLIVDLSAVEYCDSAGLSALLLAQRQMSVNGGDVRLVGLRPSVAALLQLTQLDRVFPTFETVDAALDAEPSFGDDEDDLPLNDAFDDRPLGPGAPSVNEIKAGAIAAGGSFGAAALAKIMMSPYEENLDELQALTDGQFLAYDDDLEEEEEEDDDLVDEIDEEELDDEEFDDDDDLDEEDDVEEEDLEEGEVDEDVLEDDEFEDDDFDDEELEEDDVDTV
jgi:anti-sigma B factor antagonist